MKSLKFFKSKLFLSQLAIAFIILIALIWLTLISLKWYTHHDEELTVPDLYGMHFTDATDTIQNQHLRYSIYDSIYNPKFEPGAIMDQRPLAGAIVKRNRNLFLTINANQPEQVRFPNLINNSFRQAYEILITNGFKIGRLEYQNNKYFNLVLFPKFLGDSIAAGSMINKGATIDLVLGKGNNLGIIAPNLIGKNQVQASDGIILSNMNIGNVKFDESIINHFDSIQAKVYKQRPRYNENIKIRPGTSINIWLTRDSLKIHNADSLLRMRMSNLLY